MDDELQPIYEIYHNKKWINLNGNYLITKDGKVFSKHLKRQMKTYFSEENYENLTLHYYDENNNKKVGTFSVHRLVMFTFKKEGFNKDNKNEVNHIDGNKHNNSLFNLEWCSGKENINHAIKNNLISKEQLKKFGENGAKIARELKPRSKKVVQIDKETNKVIKEYPSVYEASRQTKIPASSIYDLCKDRYPNNKSKYNWKYV